MEFEASIDDKKRVLTNGGAEMKLKKMLVAILTGMMIWMSVGTAVALVRGDEVSPMFTHTRRAEVVLTISEGGYAECRGSIRTNKSGGSITITITLYQQIENGWGRVAGWTDYVEELTQLEVKKYRSIEKGSYRLIMNGKVITSEGEVENIRKISTIVTY